MTRTGRGERGAVTAELAMVLPLLLAVTAGLVIGDADGLVVVTVSASVAGPGGLLAALPGAQVSGEATAAREPAAGGVSP